MPPPSFEDRSAPSGDGLAPLPPEFDPRGRRHARQVTAQAQREQRSGGGGRGPSRGSRTKLIALVVCTALSVTILAVAGTYWWKFNQFKSSLSRVDIAAAQQSSPSDPDGSDQDILVAGNDDRTDMTNAEVRALHTGRSGGSLNTDTMMIIHLPVDGSRATLISLPRDSYVAIPGYGMDKLNAAYPDAYTATKGDLAAKRSAGASLLVRTVQALTGLHIDHYVQVDLLGFYRISNAIGGVSVNMCGAVKEQNSGINLHKGVNVIEGVQALAFVRQRYGFANGLGDLDRVKRQQYFLTAAFGKVASAGILLNPFKLQHLLSAIQNSLFMDASLDPLKLGRQLENLTANKIVGKTIPTDGFSNTGVGSVVVVHPQAVRAFVTNVVRTEGRTASSVKPATTTTPTKPTSTKAPATDSKCIN
ncbi:MAG: LCP family protein [Jatrophihabitantaceae bacterium]